MLLSLIPSNRAGAGDPLAPGWVGGGSVAANASGVQSPTLAGAHTRPAATPLPAATSGQPLRNFMDHFYFRMWTLPRVLDAQNPQIGSPIPFHIWNSYLDANEVTGVTATGGDGLDISVGVGDVFRALEYKQVSVTITESAPYQIDARFSFEFDQGSTALRFLAQLADILPIEADTGIREEFEWLTDVLPNYDGSEQRIALRPRPRRSVVVTLTLEDDADRKALYDRLYSTLANSVIVPTYQYQSLLKRPTVIGDNRIYCNPRRADLREGENAIIVTREGTFFYYKVDKVFTDHVTITTAFSQVIRKTGTKVVGGFAGRMPDGTALAMRALGGGATIEVNISESREQLAHPDWPVALPTMGRYPMLLRRPIVTGDAAEAFNAGLEIIDNKTGKPAQYTAWKQRFVSGGRSYLINSLFDKDEMQYWRLFLDYCRGQQRAFYTPTYRQDLVKVEGTDLLVTQVIVEGSQYAMLYADSPTYQQLEIETSAGTFQVKVANIENNGVSTTINFDAPIDADLTGATVERISYLMLVRLGNDRVGISHESTFSTIDLNLKAVLE